MAWLTPYVINGAAHSASLFRRQAQRPAGENPGVSRPGDLKVLPLNTPGEGFRIAIGGASVPSRFPSRDRESYGIENADEEIVITDVEGVSSSTVGRRDAVLIEILDPNYVAIEHAEAAPLNYMRVRVIQGVPASARTIDDLPDMENVTGYVPAFIQWPAEPWGIVTESMIQDVRTLANPRSQPFMLTYALGEELDVLSATGVDGEVWPTGIPTAWGPLFFPGWANKIRVSSIWHGVKIPPGNAYGHVWIRFRAGSDEFATQRTRWNTPGVTNDSVTPFGMGDHRTIPAALRGRNVSVHPMGRLLHASANSARPVMDSGSSIVLQGEFYQEAI